MTGWLVRGRSGWGGKRGGKGANAQGELAELVADHVLGDLDLVVDLAVVHVELEPHEAGQDGRGPRLRLDRLHALAGPGPDDGETVCGRGMSASGGFSRLRVRFGSPATPALADVFPDVAAPFAPGGADRRAAALDRDRLTIGDGDERNGGRAGRDGAGRGGPRRGGAGAGGGGDPRASAADA